jgi:hypothetical protein
MLAVEPKPRDPHHQGMAHGDKLHPLQQNS